MTSTPLTQNDTPPAKCQKCKDGQELEFDIVFAYQPIVDLRARSIYAHEALVRGPNGESAFSVLSQVTDANRYLFDQACRVQAIKGAAELGLKELLSINFLPNAVYQPAACIRSTFEAAQRYNFPIERIINVRVLAEGIETKPEHDFLRNAGIDLMQGYWFCKPAFRAQGVVDPSAGD